MSQLNVDTIKDRLGTDQPDIVGAAKAWINFNGVTGGTFSESLNVASITDNGLGNFDVNFSSAFSNNNYVTVVTVNDTNGAGLGYRGSVATTSVQVLTADANPVGAADYSATMVAIFDL